MNTKELIAKLRAEKRSARDRFYKYPENKEIYGNKERKPEEFKDKTFLFIRATGTDTGARPLPGGTIFWNSPDIELFSPAGLVIPTNQLETNNKYCITVLVHNEGDMACNSCIVELFICNPSIGFDRPHATLIGIQNVSVQGHNTVVARFDFTPGLENLGHQCLFARAYSYASADMPDSAEQFNTTTDRHIGQQNLSVINDGTTYEFMVFLPGKIKKQAMSLKLTQNMTLPQNQKMNFLLKYRPTGKVIAANRIPVMKNNGPVTEFKLSQNRDPNPPVKSFFIRLLLFILSLFFKKRIDTSRYEIIKPEADNTWTTEFTGHRPLALYASWKRRSCPF
jgi:hypothetical protein